MLVFWCHHRGLGTCTAMLTRACCELVTTKKTTPNGARILPLEPTTDRRLDWRVDGGRYRQSDAVGASGECMHCSQPCRPLLPHRSRSISWCGSHVYTLTERGAVWNSERADCGCGRVVCARETSGGPMANLCDHSHSTPTELTRDGQVDR